MLGAILKHSLYPNFYLNGARSDSTALIGCPVEVGLMSPERASVWAAKRHSYSHIPKKSL